MIDELKVALQTTWEELPQEHINKAVANFTIASSQLPAWMPVVVTFRFCCRCPSKYALLSCTLSEISYHSFTVGYVTDFDLDQFLVSYTCIVGILA